MPPEVGGTDYGEPVMIDSKVSWAAAALAAILLSGCATDGDRSLEDAALQPTSGELRRLIAAELAEDPRFDSFAASSMAARRMAASFDPVLAGVNKLGCRPAHAARVDCTIEVILRFPGLDGRESRTVWERRLRLGDDGWQLVGREQP